MGKGFRSALLGLVCVYLLAQHGHSSPTRQDYNVDDMLKEEQSLKRLLDALQQNKLRQAQENESSTEENESNEEETQESESRENEDEAVEIKVRGSESGHGWELDQQELDPDSKVGHLAESFIDVHNGHEEKAKGVDPKKSKVLKGTNMDHHMLTHDQKVELGIIDEDGSTKEKRNFLTNVRLWPQGIIPYVISNDFDSSQRATIERAINEMKTKTCVRFEPKNNNHATQLKHTSYIEFFSESGCWSYVGKVFGKKQQISLQRPGCVTNAITIHEMTHAMGMMHEQSRNDRDKYVEILWQNVAGGTGNNNMAKSSTQDKNPYDAESVLQYSVYSFSTNGQKTIRFKDPRIEFLADSADGLEFYDVWDITKVYRCTDHCKNPPVCQNGGFVDFQCKCFCPSGTKGTTCELADTDAGCGGIVDISSGAQIIQTPNYPNNYVPGTKCVWLVKASQGKLVKVDIRDLHLSDNTQNSRCYHWLEVRYNLPGQTGPRQCGDATSGSYQTTIEGEGNLMILIFDSKFSSDKPADKGFQLIASEIGLGCSNNPCVYGTCSSTGNDYTCTCSTGITGKNCDQIGPNAVLTCSFDSNGCFMSNAQGDNFDWTKTSGRTPSSGTGPSQAHTGTQYMYAEMSSPRQPGEVARLESNVVLPTASARCLKMWYHMYGGTVRTLSVLYKGTGVSDTQLWSQTGDKGNQWHEVFINIPSVAGLQIIIQAERGSSWNSDIAIDDLELKGGNCPNTPTSPSPTTPSTAAPSPTTPSTAAPSPTTPSTAAPSPTTPSTAAPSPTTPSTAAPSPTTPSTAAPSPTTPSTAAPSPTTPSTAAPSPTTPSTAAPSPTTPSTAAPSPTTPSTAMPPSSDYTCNFEVADPCFLVDDVVDDFDWTVKQGGTPSRNTGPDAAVEGSRYAYIEASAPRRNGHRAVLVSNVPLPVMNYCLSFQYSMYGKFMGSLNIFRETTSVMDLLWTESGDHGKGWKKAAVDVPAGVGVKIYIEGIRGGSYRSDAAIDDVKLTAGNCGCEAQPCKNGGTCTTTTSGFTCACATGFSGPTCAAIDVDDMRCTFEDGQPCFLVQESSDKFDWTIRSGITPSSGTGPTQALEGNNYAYIETSSPRASGDLARLTLDGSLSMSNDARCLTFAYHMYGSNMGTLRVLVQDDATAQYPMWEMNGDQGNQWINSGLQLPGGSSNLKITFEGERGNGYRGDIAIDNVRMFKGTCGCEAYPCRNGGTCNPATSTLGYTCTCAAGFTGTDCETIDTSVPLLCSFEDQAPRCFMENLKLLDDFDWTVRSGRTPSSRTGPSAAAAGSKYLYIETSSPRRNGDFAIFTSENLDFATSADRCLRFQYHMYGSNIGSLKVFSGSKGLPVKAWEKSGNQGNQWFQAQVDIPAVNNLAIKFEANRNNGYRGDIAIDEVELIPGQCST